MWWATPRNKQISVKCSLHDNSLSDKLHQKKTKNALPRPWKLTYVNVTRNITMKQKLKKNSERGNLIVITPQPIQIFPA